MFRMKQNRNKHKGIALVIALIFMMVFSALSVAMFSMSSGNVTVASNLHTVNEARSSAESGLEVIRYSVSQATISGSVNESQRFENLANQLVSTINDSSVGSAYFHDSGEPHVHIGFSGSPIALDSSEDNNFYARITPNGSDGVNVSVTGNSGQVDRTINSGFTYGVRKNSVFDFGVATKGPLSLQGNILLDGVNISVESDVYIESLSQNQALEIVGNSQIAGDVKIVNPDAYVTLQGGQAGIGGETGADAIDNHVQIGVESTEFPYPDTSHFEQYATGDTIDASTDLGSYSSLDNVRIAAGTNPTFTANTQINGVLYVESPNVVSFGGNADITGIIVCEGDVHDNSGTNQLDFQGNVSSTSVSELPDSYGDLKNETGTFIMAPGFSVSMGGNFGTLNGCIAANGVEFYGNAGGVIGGSVVNYSTTPMELSGNSDLLFNRSGITDVPAGFVPEIVIHYDPSSYDEVL